MKIENWEQIKSVFAEVLEEPKERRELLLLKLCGGDMKLREEVESLLSAHDATNEHFIEDKEFSVGSILQSDEVNYEGKQFGHYRIMREIGRGGMGAVFLAERSDGAFEQLVALKIVRRSFADTEIERHFRQERQILASLNHPNIARLLDGGVSEDGEPFFVMEYVEGERINKFCFQSELSTDERLKLFLAVCNAVDFAHQNLVVHRDIKPSNILVLADGTPKLLDFGIAKLTGAEHADQQTQTFYRAFTPEYASPEQIAGEPVTTASDVYSLGVLLAEMLCDAYCHTDDAPPAQGKWQSNESEDSESKTIVTNIPTTQEGEKLTDAELNDIIAMARREEPARRYASVRQLAEDIQRYLDGLPVRAQRDSFTYRTGKFVKRNRLPVAAIALVMLSLIAGVAVAAWQAGIAREKARIAEENQIKAEIAAEKQKKITGFMEKVLSYANPMWYAEGNRFKEPARVIDVLNDLSGKIETEFPADLDIQAELHHKCAEIFLANKMIDRAETHARRALVLRRQIFGERHAEVAKDLYYLGEVLSTRGNYLEHEKLLNQAGAIFREVAPDNANFPYLLESLGALKESGYHDFDEAEKLLNESLELFRQRDEIHFNTARLYFKLSVNAAGKGEPARAEEFFREGETRAAKLPDAEQRLTTLNFRGSLELARGNLAAAKAAFKQSIDESRKLKGANNGFEREVRNSLRVIYERENDWAKLAEIQRAKVEAMRNQIPETSPEFGNELARLSIYLLRYGKTHEAERHFEKAYRIFQNNNHDSEASFWLRYHIGECLLLLNRRNDALPLLEKNYEFYKVNYPPNFHDRIRAEKLLEQSRLVK